MEINSWYCHDCFRYFEQGERVVCVSKMKSVFCKKCGNDFPAEWIEKSTFKRNMGGDATKRAIKC